MIRLANAGDIDQVEQIYNLIHDEEENGNMQIGWLRNVYPIRQTAIDALRRRELFVEEVDCKVVASAIINQQQVPEYKDCHWNYPTPNETIMVLHTLTVNPAIKGKGYGREFVKFYENYARQNGCHFLRMDTQSKNISARKFYKKLGYSEPGIVYCTFNGIPNVELVCLEKKLSSYNNSDMYIDILRDMKYFLTTNRCGFSHWRDTDIELAKSLWGEPEVTKYICASGIFTKDNIKNRLNTEIQNYNKYGVQYFPFFELNTNDLIGCCGLRPYGNKEDIYELGFHLRRKYWGKGYAIETASAMIDYAFNVLHAVELKAGHNPNNTASKKVLSKLGFEYEKDEFYEPTGLYHPLYRYRR